MHCDQRFHAIGVGFSGHAVIASLRIKPLNREQKWGILT